MEPGQFPGLFGYFQEEVRIPPVTGRIRLRNTSSLYTR